MMGEDRYLTGADRAILRTVSAHKPMREDRQVIPEDAVEAAVDALVASKLGDHSGINGEEFVEAARAALEAAAPYMLASAWDEGEAAGQDNADSNRGHDIDYKRNPYRSQE